MPSKLERAVEVQLEQVESAIAALNKQPKETAKQPIVATGKTTKEAREEARKAREEARKVDSNRRELLSVLQSLQIGHASSARATGMLVSAKQTKEYQITAFKDAGIEIAEKAKAGRGTRSATVKETKAQLAADQASKQVSSSSKALSKAQDIIADKQQDLFAFIIARDPIAQMSPNGDIADAVRKTKAGSNFGGLLKQFALDRVKKSSVHAIVLVNLNQAIEAYISSVARACIAEPVKTCEKLAKGEPIEFIGTDEENHLKNLKNAVQLAYVKINEAQEKKPFMLESRTQKLLEEMGEKLGIGEDLKKIKDKRVEGYSKKNKI